MKPLYGVVLFSLAAMAAMPGLAQVAVPPPADALAPAPAPASVAATGEVAGATVPERGFRVNSITYEANLAFDALRNRQFELAIQKYEALAANPAGGQRYAKMVERVKALRRGVNQGTRPALDRLPEDERLQQQYWLGWNPSQVRSEAKIKEDIEARDFAGKRERIRIDEGRGVVAGSDDRMRQYDWQQLREQSIRANMPGYSNLEAQNMANELP